METSDHITKAPHMGQPNEMLDRLRRIETRMTAFFEWSGYATKVEKPRWNDEEHCIHIPSMDVRLKDILAAIPKDRDAGLARVGIVHKGGHIRFLS